MYHVGFCDVLCAALPVTFALWPQSFTLQLGSGGAFATVFATETNSLNKTVFAARGERGRHLRLRMHEAGGAINLHRASVARPAAFAAAPGMGRSWRSPYVADACVW